MKNNFVAKHARTFNKAQVHRDRTKYKRQKSSKNSYLEEYLLEKESKEKAPYIS